MLNWWAWLGRLDRGGARAHLEECEITVLEHRPRIGDLVGVGDIVARRERRRHPLRLTGSDIDRAAVEPIELRKRGRGVSRLQMPKHPHGAHPFGRADSFLDPDQLGRHQVAGSIAQAESDIPRTGGRRTAEAGGTCGEGDRLRSPAAGPRGQAGERDQGQHGHQGQSYPAHDAPQADMVGLSP